MRSLTQAAPWLLFTSPDSTSMQSAGLPKTDMDMSFVPGGTCRPRVGKVGHEPSTYPAAASIVSPANCDTSIASYMTSPIRNSPRVRVPARQAPGTSDPTAVSRIKALTPTHPRMIPAATIPLPAVTRAATGAAVSQRRGGREPAPWRAVPARIAADLRQRIERGSCAGRSGRWCGASPPDRRPGKIAAWNVCLESGGISCGPPTRRP